MANFEWIGKKYIIHKEVLDNNTQKLIIKKQDKCNLM